jgi:hypothetical protein
MASEAPPSWGNDLDLTHVPVVLAPVPAVVGYASRKPRRIRHEIVDAAAQSHAVADAGDDALAPILNLERWFLVLTEAVVDRPEQPRTTFDADASVDDGERASEKSLIARESVAAVTKQGDPVGLGRAGSPP